ncbi:MAG: hemerythrin domain-containing protein [Bdellovibrionota bacterium]
MEKFLDRRHFITKTLVVGAGLSLLAPLARAEEKEEEVSALEDLMREHGALNRVLLIYEECQRRIQGKGPFQAGPLNQAASIIHNFIESYHEKLEEEYLFPRLEKAGKLAELCRTLKLQHAAGRKLTSEVLDLSKGNPQRDSLKKIDSSIAMFLRMYRPHEAFEDTVVFPEFKKILPRKEYDQLGDKFEEREHKQLGKEGFEGVLEQIAHIEISLGIDDIRQFTPKS